MILHMKNEAVGWNTQWKRVLEVHLHKGSSYYQTAAVFIHGGHYNYQESIDLSSFGSVAVYV